MNILVCFKLVPDLDMLFSGEWAMDDTFQIDTRYVKTILNPYDESALEMVLKLHDEASKKDFELNMTALTIGTGQADRAAKNLYALQYDSVIRINCDWDIRFNAPIVSKIIEQYSKRLNRETVLVMGDQSNEGNNAKTPLLVAERLRIPCITSVCEIKLSEQVGCLDVVSIMDHLMIKQTVSPPIVLSIGNAPNSRIRVPTLKDKMLHSKKEVEIIPLADLSIEDHDAEDENDAELIDLRSEQNERNCILIKGDSSTSKVTILYEEFLEERVRR